MIDSFTGRYRFLSNFFPAAVFLDGLYYPTVEHAYQAAKTLDASKRAEISCVKSPGIAKRIGRTLAVRDGWGELKLTVMRNLLRQKFARDTVLCGLLLATGSEELVEGNTWGDTYWGVYRGIGENHLGKMLMEIRSIRRD